MYRIVKRIVHTITTVTWLVRLEGNSAAGEALEKEITFPSSVSVTEEEVLNTKKKPDLKRRSHQPTLFDKGETDE
jgi:hypothetical protein